MRICLVHSFACQVIEVLAELGAEVMNLPWPTGGWAKEQFGDGLWYPDTYHFTEQARFAVAVPMLLVRRMFCVV